MWTPELVKQKLDDIKYRCLITKSEVKQLHTILKPDEQLLEAVDAEVKRMHNKKHNSHGMVFLTDRRLVFFRKSIIGTVTVEEFPLAKISSTSYRKGIMHGTFIVNTSHNDAEFECYDKSATERMHTIAQELMQAHSHKPATSAPPTPSADPVAQLEKLFKLKEMGALSEDEYQAEKRKLLQS